MSKFLIGAVIVIVAIASGIGAAALAGPRLGQYIQTRVSTSSRRFGAPNQMPFPGMQPPRSRPGVPGYRGISSQSSSQVPNFLDAFGNDSQSTGSNSRIAGLPGFSNLNGGQ